MTEYKEEKYEVPMLWQEEKRSFTKNYNVAFKRFNMVKQRFKRGPDLRKRYEDTINTYIEKSYAKKLKLKFGIYHTVLCLIRTSQKSLKWFLMWLQNTVTV